MLGTLGSMLLAELLRSSLGLVGPKNGPRAAFMVCSLCDDGCLSPWLFGSRLIWGRAEGALQEADASLVARLEKVPRRIGWSRGPFMDESLGLVVCIVVCVKTDCGCLSP